MRTFLVVKNKWTGKEHIHPKIFIEGEINAFVSSWDTTNTTITIHHLIESVDNQKINELKEKLCK